MWTPCLSLWIASVAWCNYCFSALWGIVIAPQGRALKHSVRLVITPPSWLSRENKGCGDGGEVARWLIVDSWLRAFYPFMPGDQRNRFWKWVAEISICEDSGHPIFQERWWYIQIPWKCIYLLIKWHILIHCLGSGCVHFSREMVIYSD